VRRNGNRKGAAARKVQGCGPIKSNGSRPFHDDRGKRKGQVNLSRPTARGNHVRTDTSARTLRPGLTALALTNPHRLRPGSRRGSSPLSPHRNRSRGAPTATAPATLSPTTRFRSPPDAIATARATRPNDATRHAPTPAWGAHGTRRPPPHERRGGRTGAQRRSQHGSPASARARPTRPGARPPPDERTGPARRPAQASLRLGPRRPRVVMVT
jgi:hypothetical protein